MQKELKLRILGNKKLLEKSQTCMRAQPCVRSYKTLQKVYLISNWCLYRWKFGYYGSFLLNLRNKSISKIIFFFLWFNFESLQWEEGLVHLLVMSVLTSWYLSVFVLLYSWTATGVFWMTEPQHQYWWINQKCLKIPG